MPGWWCNSTTRAARIFVKGAKLMLEWIVTIVAVVGMIGTGIGVIRKQAKMEQHMQDELKAMKDNEIKHITDGLAEIKSIIGNGNQGGLKHLIASIQVACAANMATLTTTVRTHGERLDRLEEH